jgi:hypothetical protein
MLSRAICLLLLIGLWLDGSLLWAASPQQTTTEAASALPRLVRFSGTVKDLNGNPLTGVVGIIFALYSEQTGGAALWLETQNVTADSNGHYVALLGTTKPDGLPADLFNSEQARWVGVQVSGQAEQPRVLLVSAPYALKAGDAETIGGLPPSAFMLAKTETAGAGKSAGEPVASTPKKNAVPPANPDVTGKGVVDYIPMWDTTSDIVDSIIFQKSSEIGINTKTPAATLDVNGKSDIRDTLTLFPKGTDSTLAINGTAFKVDQTGKVTFISGQTFPGTGSGTVTSVGLSAPSTDFTVSGSPVTSSGTLKFAWSVPPTNADTANAIVKRDASGNFSAGVITATDENLSDVLAITSAANNPIFASTSATTGATAVYGVATSTTSTGTAFGVEGVTAGTSNTSYGVVGDAVATSGVPYGVYGVAQSPTGIGVFGQNGTISGSGAEYLGNRGFGMFGDAGVIYANTGVGGFADNGMAGVFQNNSPDGFTTLSAGAENASSFPFSASNSATGDSCEIDAQGDLLCTGTTNAVAPLDGGARRVALSAIQSPKNWFEDFGSAQLSSGSAVVAIDPDFAQTVNTATDYMVIPVPNGDCKGLYVTNKTPTSFTVQELGGGTSSIRFDYRIVVLRKNYENVRFADHTNDPIPGKQMLRRGQPGKPQAF